ncbi:MAG: diguanylate cyclase [Acidimicrobiia bacterium]|nr:diguanylate cyclase [Acidimicrobiia bacterium]NNF69261.1 diguanylate cyclase [Acidimicrobiia bacterium]
MSARVMIIDGDRTARSLLRDTLTAAGIEVVAEANDCDEARLLIEGSQPDIALVDVAGIRENASEVARSLREQSAFTMAIIAMAPAERADRVAELVGAGAVGYVIKEDERQLLAAVEAIHKGEGFLSPEVARPVLDEVSRLYEREKIRNDELEELVRQLQALSVTDWLTGLKNHGYYFDRLSDELDRSLRHRRPMSVVIGDIDDFKQINDTRGHAAGDRVLQEVSAAMADAIRSADIVCRIGGEEFGFLLPETDSAGSVLVAERVREAVAALNITGVGSVTVSLGVASVPEHAVDRDELMEAADRALYLAKREGKNRVRVAGQAVALGGSKSQKSNGRMQIVDLLVRVLRLRDPRLAEASTRTAEVAIALGAQANLSTARLEHLRVAALLQEVGKIGVPDSVLYKRGALTEDEWKQIREHPKKGFELVGGLIHPEAGEAVLANHERWDGAGYPRGLKGEEIPLLARVLLVADAYVAMTMDRPFRTAMTPQDALEELRKNAGTQFDPGVVDLMGDLASAMQLAEQQEAEVIDFPEQAAG